ncbi:hypothetical protein GY45DRAFT_1429653 [Cubamyces sp. BRFM 1775]|nr:hypothetical protein GY45DRAFT_1429653 [Cubamyces sp. BRFM 1775]
MNPADSQYRLLEFPILLAPSAGSASVSTTSKYRFISSCSYDYLATQRVHVSDLKEAVVEVVKEAEGYQDRPNSDFQVKIYECLELPVPAAPTIVSMCEAYEVVNEEWLKRHCNFIHEVNESLGQIHREQIAAAAHQRQSPSSGATVSQLLQTQTTLRIDAVYNCRPLELTGPPITMYHPVFANFL